MVCPSITDDVLIVSVPGLPDVVLMISCKRYACNAVGNVALTKKKNRQKRLNGGTLI